LQIAEFVLAYACERKRDVEESGAGLY